MKTINALPAAMFIAAAMIFCTAMFISENGESAQPSRQKTPAAEASTPWEQQPSTLDPRSQYILVKQMIAARANEDEADAKLATVRKGWEGHRVRWEMRYLGPLCQNANNCVVAPVDYNRFEKRVVQGWLPHLELSKAAHQKIKHVCQNHTRCVVSFEAKVRELVLSTQQPTSMVLAEVAVIAARSVKDSESWIKRKADPRHQPAMARR